MSSLAACHIYNLDEIIFYFLINRYLLSATDFLRLLRISQSSSSFQQAIETYITISNSSYNYLKNVVLFHFICY